MYEDVLVFYLALICLVVLLMCGAAAVAEALEPDRDLQEPWDPRA